MKAIRVNIDYEEVLRGGNTRPQMNAAIEFLALWVQDAPLLAHRDYSDDYLAHVQTHSGRNPQLIRSGEAINWWGELQNIELEKKLNSKLWARKWWFERADIPCVVAYSADEVEAVIVNEGPWLIKRDYGMSGRGHWKTTRAQWPETKERLKVWFSEGVLVEPLLERAGDLSALWLPDEARFIFYRNVIDERFQWRGAVIENGGSPQFANEEKALLTDWSVQLNQLTQDIQALGYHGVFSVDAFFYQQNGQLKFMPCSEINARRTMGWIVYNLWKKNRPSKGQLRLEGEGIRLAPNGAPFSWVWSEA
jgi:hypothetical protein